MSNEHSDFYFLAKPDGEQNGSLAEKAEGSLRSKDFSTALKCFDDILIANPKSAYANLGKLLAQRGCATATELSAAMQAEWFQDFIQERISFDRSVKFYLQGEIDHNKLNRVLGERINQLGAGKNVPVPDLKDFVRRGTLDTVKQAFEELEWCFNKRETLLSDDPLYAAALDNASDEEKERLISLIKASGSDNQSEDFDKLKAQYNDIVSGVVKPSEEAVADKYAQQKLDAHLSIAGTASKLGQVASGQQSTKKSGCYIATSVYGTYECPQVWVLRRFRDTVLANRKVGKAFIRVYYSASPSFVAHCGDSGWFISFWRRLLDAFVGYLKEKGVSDAPYKD